MTKNELNEIQELIERKILLAEINGGITSTDKKFINLWNYTIILEEQLQQKEDIIKEAKEYVINHLKQDMLSDFTGANYIQEYIEEPDGLLEILDNKGE